MEISAQSDVTRTVLVRIGEELIEGNGRQGAVFHAVAVAVEEGDITRGYHPKLLVPVIGSHGIYRSAIGSAGVSVGNVGTERAEVRVLRTACIIPVYELAAVARRFERTIESALYFVCIQNRGERHSC